jgi:hypothetical protein
MQMFAVSSSNLSAVGYDPDDLALVTTFKNGTTYKYLNVPPSLFQGLMSAPSKGTYFNRNIKDRFRFVRMQ